MGYDGLLSFRGFTWLPVRLDRFWPCGSMCFGLRVQDKLQPCCAGRGSHCFVRLAVHRQGWPCIFSDRGRASLGQNLSCRWPFKNLAFQIIFQRTFLDFRFLTMNDNGPAIWPVGAFCPGRSLICMSLMLSRLCLGDPAAPIGYHRLFASWRFLFSVVRQPVLIFIFSLHCWGPCARAVFILIHVFNFILTGWTKKRSVSSLQQGSLSLLSKPLGAHVPRISAVPD